MGNMTNREVAERYGRAIVERDLDTMDQLRHADYVSEYPQSGERIRGTANARAMHEHYPGGLPRSEADKIHGGEDHWVSTPIGTLLRIDGTGDVYTALVTVFYSGEDRPWHLAVVIELRDGKVLKETAIFGPPFDPPAWRAQWVESIRDRATR